MKSCKTVYTLIFLMFAAGVVWAADSSKSTAAPPILPHDFSGWQVQGETKASKDAGAADPANAAVLKEYGFTDVASATYAQEDGRTLKIRAARFQDASGAFGAYTFYLQPDMRKEAIGDQGASLGQRVLFYRGHVLVDALFSKQDATSGAELRSLAGELPRPEGNSGKLPGFLEYLPKRGYIANTQKYALGPKALTAIGAPLAPELLDFSVEPEVVLGRYSTSSGEATLMLISYPTPQLAAAQLRKIDESKNIAPAQPGVDAIQKSGEFFDRRSGTFIAIATGPISDSDAKSLLGSVNWQANVTWQLPHDEGKQLGGLLVNIIILCFVLGAMAVVAGVAFGGFRILMKRLYPDKVFDRPEQMEFISLHLAETAAEGGPGASGSGPRQPGPGH